MSLLAIPGLHVKRIAEGSVCLIWDVCLVWGEGLALVGDAQSGDTLGLPVLDQFQPHRRWRVFPVDL